MFDDGWPAAADLFRDAANDKATRDAADELSSTVITGYERALQHGLAPWHALALILSWAAEETARLHDEAATRCDGDPAVKARSPGAGAAVF